MNKIEENRRDIGHIFLTGVKRAGAKELWEWLNSETDFFTAPASTKYHGAYPGGLAEHSLNVYNELCKETVETVAGMETAAICGLFHDVCKVNYYHQETEGGPYTARDTFPFGHGEKSVYLISRFIRLTDEEALAIRWHMGAYDDAHRGGSRGLNEAMRLSPLVYQLHAADMRATHIVEAANGGVGA